MMESGFGILNFGFWIYFEFRISNFGFVFSVLSVVSVVKTPEPRPGVRSARRGCWHSPCTADHRTKGRIMNCLSFAPRRPHSKRRRPRSRRLELELLEARNPLSSPPTNVLVNDPGQDGA